MNWVKRLFKKFGLPIKNRHWIKVKQKDYIGVDERYTENAKEHPFWEHPPGYPFQVYGEPLLPESERFSHEVWTSNRSLDGYKLVEDEYSDRLYHIAE